MSNIAESEKRVISVDILKGLAIMGVLLIHPTLYDNFHTPANAQSIIPTYLFFFLLPLTLLATFAGVFPLLSCLISTYNINKRLEKGMSFRSAAAPILINSTILILIDPIKSILFGRTYYNDFNPSTPIYSILGGLLQKGEFIFTPAEKIFQIGILPAIGISGFMTVFFLWILFNKEGRIKVKRNILILLVIGLALAASYHTISTTINPYIVQSYNRGGIFVFLAYLMRLFVGHPLSFFPMGIYSIFGIIFGIFLGRKIDFKWIKRFGIVTGFLFLIGFATSFTIEVVRAQTGAISVIYDIMDYYMYPKELLFISLSIVMFAFILFIKGIEYRSDEKRAKISKRTSILKKFGTITLTIYLLEPILNQLISAGFHYGFNGGVLYPFNTPDLFMTNGLAVFLFEVTFILFWILFVFLWSKINFRFSLEHIIMIITNPIRKIKSKKLDLSKPEDENALETTDLQKEK